MPNRRLDRRRAGEIITGLQEFQTTLGFPETGNFKEQSGSVKASLDLNKYDIFILPDRNFTRSKPWQAARPR